MLITVFTPTYNRAYLLGRLFESLCQQQYSDFEWVVVDDESTDDTANVIKCLSAKALFPVRYFYQPNGGKHRAINRGVKEARGELFFIADSDDALADDALAEVANRYCAVANDETFAGVVGLDETYEGELIGAGLPYDVIDCNSIDIRLKYGVTGDMKEVFRTEVLREYPFPEFEGERFCPEALLWGRIAQKYKMRYFNRAIYRVEYQSDGLTQRIVRIRMDSPMASTTHYSELNGYDVPMAQRLKAAINYWRFWYCLADKRLAPHLPTVWHMVKPLGWAMHLRDLRTVRHRKSPKK